MQSYLKDTKCVQSVLETTSSEFMPKRAHIESLVADEDWTDAFMVKIKENDGPLDTPCWEWQGGLDRAGYGRIHVKKHCEKKTGRNFFAHRMCYMIHRGYIESEEFILHQCHNRLCCNPAHHKLGDHNDNMDDLAKSGRVAGANNHNSKLSEEDAWEIMVLYYEGDADSVLWSVVELSKEFDIGRGTVTDLIYGRTWKSLYEEFWGEDDSK